MPIGMSLVSAITHTHTTVLQPLSPTRYNTHTHTNTPLFYNLLSPTRYNTHTHTNTHTHCSTNQTLSLTPRHTIQQSCLCLTCLFPPGPVTYLLPPYHDFPHPCHEDAYVSTTRRLRRMELWSLPCVLLSELAPLCITSCY
eukprot:GHVQ01032197.1.p1 GENE.GHVQ01032197.1~~GHVQ01032197.1.p1  ORF type:complete len:141 (+),score=37.46 GHVQ01032197.1:264-686(+)